MTRRNHVMRHFIDLVIARVHDGMTIDRAAELMLEHHVPKRVAANVLARIQREAAATATQPTPEPQP